MTKIFAPVVALSLLSGIASAYDSDPGYGSRSESPTVTRSKVRTTGPTYYYKPTMRYFGNGYTVTYRYVQWNDRMKASSGTTFDTARHNLPVGSVEEVGTLSPRVTFYHGAQAQTVEAERPAQSVVKPPTKEVPPISGSTGKKP